MLRKKIFNGVSKRISRRLGSILPSKLLKEQAIVRFTSLAVETTNVCNANCVFCGKENMRRQHGTMNQELFKKIVEDYSYIGGGELNLTPMIGEPLIDPYLLHRISYARRFNNIGPIYFYTNGILINKVLSNGLLDCGIDRIMISIMGHDRKSYKKIAGVDKWFTVIENVEEVLKVNREKGNPVDICIHIRTDLPLMQLKHVEIYQKLGKLTDKIEFQYHYHNWGGGIKREDNFAIMSKERKGRLDGPCYILFRGPKILWDGKVSACLCINYDGEDELIIGSIKETKLIDLWQSVNMKRLRDRFWKNEMPKICQSCSHYKSFSYYLDLTHRREISRCYHNYISSKRNLK